MPSPFPGMDPYLEGSSWMEVHTQLSSEIARQLAPKLRPKYRAVATRRFVMDPPEGVDIEAADLIPDVSVSESGAAVYAGREAGIAAAPLRLATVIAAPIPHITIEVRDVAERRLVTAIEVLSPSNKRGRSRDEYLQKRQRLLRSLSHLMEIDLLRSGRRVPMARPLPPAPYFVFLSRAECRPITEVWPIALDQPLPTVPVPLLEGDADVPLDLQLALASVYDVYGFDLDVDYRKPPEVTLGPEAMAWAEERLRERGLRP